MQTALVHELALQIDLPSSAEAHHARCRSARGDGDVLAAGFLRGEGGFGERQFRPHFGELDPALAG